MSKICVVCKIDSPLEKYTKDCTRKDGLCPLCTDCRKIQNANSYKIRSDILKNKRLNQGLPEVFKRGRKKNI